MTKFLNNADIKGYIAQTAVTSYLLKADSTGRLVAAIAGTDYQAPTTALLPSGGTAGQILAKIDGTNYNTQWIDNFAQQIKYDVKLGAALSKGTPVYVSSANGTNIIVSASSNATEATSSKTLGLLETGGALNDIVKVVSDGLLSGLNTSAATIGDPVWLGVNGALIFGLANKPSAPAHLVYIGAVTRVHATNGEIFIKVQNGFELDELHNVSARTPSNNDVLYYNTSTSLWQTASIPTVLGYTPEQSLTFSSPLVRTVNTISIPAATASVNGYLSSADWTTFNSKQAALSGTGFVKINGTTISYDNSTYLTTSAAASTYLMLGGGTMTGALIGTSAGFTGYVGVGNTSPLYPLDVTGNTRVSGQLILGSTISNGTYTYTLPSATGTLALTSALSSYLPLSGGTLTGALSGTSASFNSTLTTTGGTRSIQLVSYSADYNYLRSNGAPLVFGTQDSQDLYIKTNDTTRLTLVGSTGAATFSSSVTAGGIVTAPSQFQLSGSSLPTGLNLGVGGNTPLLEFHANFRNSQNTTYRGGELRIDTRDGQSLFSFLSRAAGSTVDNFLLSLSEAGQLKLTTYTSATSYSGTAAGYLAFDSSGNVITVAGVAATDNTKLPLTGGALTGPLTITGNGSYLGDWGYKTLELNDTSGYAGIFFKNGANIWITRRNGADNAMDWAYSTNATAQGTGTFTQKMRLATDEWWVSTYTGYKLQVTGGDQINTTNAGAATTLYLQYHGNVGGNVNISASKFIFYNTGELSLSGGSSSGQSTLASGLVSLRFPNQYSSGYTDAGVKLYIFNSGTTIQGFTAGPAYDLQYHSSGSDSGRHAFYVANSEIIRFNKTSVGVSGVLSMATSGTSYISMGRFPNSTSNSGEAWLGRAADRSAGSMTVQLGGSSNASFFEIVDYGWTTVTFKAGMNDFSYKGNAILHAGNYTSYVYSQSTSDSRYSRKDTTGQWIKPYYEYSSYLGNDLPSTLTTQMGGGGLRVDFMGSGGSATGSWSHVITFSGYNRYSMSQIGTNYNTTDARLYYRQTNNHDDAWASWKEFVFNSGTWSINVTGSSRSLLFSGDSAKAFLDGLWAGGGSYPGYQFIGGNSRFGFSSTSGVVDVYADGNFYATDSSYLVLHTGNIGSYTSGNSNQLQGSTAPYLFNNMNNAHGTYTDFNSPGDFGVRYMQGSTNGPGTGATQYYGFTLGLGSQYAFGTYGSQLYWNRVSTGGNPYISVRFQEGGAWSSWSKIYAGYADSAGYTTGYSTSVELSGRIWFNGSGNHNVSMYESYGIVMDCVSNPWNVSILNGSLLVGQQANGSNYGTGHVYANGHFRPNGDYGIYSQDYGGYFRRNTQSYGTWESTGYAKNGWGGYVNTNNYIVSWMLNTSGDFGFLTQNGNWWNLFYNNGNNCWGIGTDNTYSGDGFRCIKYGSAQYGWTTWSDRRAKENISTITGALDKVLNMRGVYFNYIIDEAKNKRVGFIAQELQQALPEAVRYAEEIDEYNVEYGQIVSVLAEAVKEHYAKTVAQQIEIDALKTQLQTLLN